MELQHPYPVTPYRTSHCIPDADVFAAAASVAAMRQQLTDAQALVASARDTLAANQAMQARLDYALREGEVLNRIRENLKTAGLSASAPDLVVNELIERVHTLEDAARANRAQNRTDDLPARAALKLHAYHCQLILDALGAPTRDAEGPLCTDGRIYWLAKKAGLDLSEFPPHLMKFHREVNQHTNAVHNVIKELEALVAKRKGPDSTEPKTQRPFALRKAA